MALYNEILVGRYNRFLQKHLGMKGRAPAPQLSSDIQSEISLQSGVENSYLQGFNLFALGDNFAAVAAQAQAWRLRNPATSNVIAVLESIVFSTQPGAAASNFGLEINFIATDLATVIATPIWRRDARGSNGVSMNTGSALVFSREQGAAPGTISATDFWTSSHATNQTIPVILYPDQQIVLLPGTAIQMRSTTVNSATGINLMWRERFLEESERT